MQHSSKIDLARQTLIRSFFALFLLLVFGFSMLPKKAVHDLSANHKDRNFPVNDYQPQFTWAGFHCNCENLVVESPFISNHFYPAVCFFPASRYEFAEPLVHLKFLFDQDENLRGPPTI